jgi:hypothetical protein
MMPLPIFTLAACEVCPFTVTTTGQDLRPDTPSGIKALSCQLGPALLKMGPES